MDLSSFDLEELFLAAIKSEVESNNLYSEMANRTKNGLLQDKLRFLANEEEKHRLFIEDIYRNHYPENEIVLPKKSSVPLPEVEISENVPLSKLLTEAMKAEQSTSKFYKSLAGRFEEGTQLYNTLLYFSDMEIGHYKFLKWKKKVWNISKKEMFIGLWYM